MIRWMVAALAAAALCSCGGGGGGSDTGAGSGGNGGVAPPPVAGPSQLVVTAAGPADPVISGTSTALDLTISNSGTGPATDVSVAASLDSWLTLTSVTCHSSNVVVCPARPALSMQMSVLPAGTSVTFHFAVAVADQLSATLASTFHVSSDDVPGGTSQDAEADVHATNAYVYVAASVSATPVPIGGVAVFTATVTNRGQDDAFDLQLSHELESTMAIGAVTCQATGTTPCPPVLGATVSIPMLAVGDSLVFTVPATVTSLNSGRAVDVVRLERGGKLIDNYNEAVASANVYDPAAPAPNSVLLASSPGDPVGGGVTRQYTAANAGIVVSSQGNAFSMDVSGDLPWHGDFQLPGTSAQIQPGTFTGVGLQSADAPQSGWLGVSDGYACSNRTDDFRSTLSVDSVGYVGSTLAAIDFRFNQYCAGATAPLQGTVHWRAADATLPPGPWTTVPADLWQPAPGITPTSGSYVYLQSHIGDFEGNGTATDSDHTFGYTQADAIIGVDETAGQMRIRITGDTNWEGDFDVMSSAPRILPGFYGGLQGQPAFDPAVGRFSWNGDGRACNVSTSWVVVDSVTYAADVLTALDARFEQHCENWFIPLHGKIHWDKSDTTQPPPPVNPPPDGLWQPAAGAVPDQGDLIYLESQAGDVVGNGRTTLDAPQFVTLYQQRQILHIATVNGAVGDFDAMNVISQLQPGYYPDITGMYAGNPTKGRMDWTMNGAGCNTVSGWFAIDRINIVNGALQAVDMRFEQRCDNGPGLLHGRIRLGY